MPQLSGIPFLSIKKIASLSYFSVNILKLAFKLKFPHLALFPLVTPITKYYQPRQFLNCPYDKHTKFAIVCTDLGKSAALYPKNG